MERRLIFQIRLSIIWLLLAIAIGAFGAHILEDMFVLGRADVFDTGSKYHFYGAFGLLAIAFITNRFDLSNHSFNIFFVGSLFFSFSLYGISLTDGPITSVLGPITPIGGLLLMISLVSIIIQLVGKKARLI